MQNSIEYQFGLPESLKPDAAKIYAQAFSRKLQKVIGEEEVLVRLLAEGMQSDRAIIALQDGDLVGVLGLNFDGRSLASMHLRSFVQEFGPIRGFFKALLADILFERKTQQGVLLMDGIAVASQARGQGIGSGLFQQLLDFAQSKNYQRIRLDVIDENPKAKRLYEKLGFKAVNHQNTWYLKWLIDVSGSTTMLKTLVPDGPGQLN